MHSLPIVNKYFWLNIGDSWPKEDIDVHEKK